MKCRTQFILALAGSILLFQACRKDPLLEEAGPIQSAGPTPLSLSIPWWVQEDVLSPVNLPAYNPITVEGVELGRKLFYDKALSNDHTMSCATCHRQENAFTDPRQFSVGTNGAVGTRNAMAIQNTAWERFFFWDGRAESLEHQAFGPVANPDEMANTWSVVVDRLQQHAAYPELFEKAFGTSTIDSFLVARALAQFERTLISFDAPFDRYMYGGDTNAMTEQQVRGMNLFLGEAHCGDCHAAPLFSDHRMSNIGLQNTLNDLGMEGVTGLAEDRWRFKSVSLRNVAVTAPYMHNGRHGTLEDVIDFYADDVLVTDPTLDEHMQHWVWGEIDLDAQERADLVSFMHALTDEGFLTNPAFSDPD